MEENTILLIYLSRAAFLMANILLMYVFLTPKRSWRFQMTAYIVTFIMAQIFREVLRPLINNPFLLGYCIGIFYLIPTVLNFKETLYAKFFVFFMSYSLTQFIALILMFLEQLIFHRIVGGLVLIGMLLELTSLPLIKKYISPHIRNITAIIQHRIFSSILFPLLVFVELTFYGVQRAELITNIIPVIVSTLLIVFTYYLMAAAIYQTRRNQEVEKQLALQREHYRNLNDSIHAMKIFRHDLHHHLVTCLEFLKKDNPAAAKEYLSHLCHHFHETTIPKICNNQSADAIISHYLKLAKQQDITVEMHLDLPEDLGIDDQDLCVILGNCLENAVEACAKVPAQRQRRINIKTAVSKGHLIIKIANSYDGLIRRQGEHFDSTKNGDEHGIGLSSIKALVAKYHGYCSIQCEEQQFKIEIALKLPEMAGDVDIGNKDLLKGQ